MSDQKKPQEQAKEKAPVTMVVLAGKPWIDGAPREVGDTVSVDAGLAEHLARNGLAEEV